MDKLQVTIFNQEGDEPFICAVNGKCTIQVLNDIEQEFKENYHNDCGDDGNYTFECTWFSGQYGEYHMCELAPGWELNQIKFESMECDHG